MGDQTDKRQEEIIQEQQQANERMIQGVERRQEGVFEGQAPVNERIKQILPNERTEPQQEPSKTEDKK